MNFRRGGEWMTFYIRAVVDRALRRLYVSWSASPSPPDLIIWRKSPTSKTSRTFSLCGLESSILLDIPYLRSLPLKTLVSVSGTLYSAKEMKLDNEASARGSTSIDCEESMKLLGTLSTSASTRDYRKLHILIGVYTFALHLIVLLFLLVMERGQASRDIGMIPTERRTWRKSGGMKSKSSSATDIPFSSGPWLHWIRS